MKKDSCFPTSKDKNNKLKNVVNNKRPSESLPQGKDEIKVTFITT